MIINDYLKENNITKYQFAKMCGMPYGTLNDICNGKTDVAKCSGETLMKIAGAMGTTVDELLHERFSLCTDNLAQIKNAIAPIGEKYKIKSVYVFGSYARNEANENSDIDILIDREGSEIHGIFGMNAFVNELKETLNKKVDVVTMQALRQSSTAEKNADFIENVLREKVKIYGYSR